MATISDPNALTHVVFRMHATPNEAKSQQAGRPIYDEMEVCDISFAGNKSTIGTFPAHEIVGYVDDPVMGRVEQTYAQKYNQEYLAFKNSDPAALGGTPLEELPFLTQAKRLELKAVHVYTAEALAALDGNNLKMLGVDGRDLKDKAQLYIDTAQQGVSNADLQEQVSKQNAVIEQMQAELEQFRAAQEPVDPRGKQALDEQAEREAEGRKTAQDIVDDADGGAPDLDTATKFADYNDDDLKNWLIDAGVDVDGRWKRTRMLKEAAAVLERAGRLANQKPDSLTP
jgi:hypothetical protein